ncbi:trypsin-like peptidase domain-containing protein [Mesorhizobium sp. ASY16-5R]|uniref:trypsin-like peptidase domain-containing protein n=1 Tax=Mesorhizobium sp. ASY16-5R TaxID=3445772 RepID=UPI003FA03E6E
MIYALLCGAAAVAHADDLPTGSGTGFFINADGWLVTNAHVIEGCTRVVVAGRGDAAEWKSDILNDLAIVRSAGSQVAPIPLRRAPPRLGEDVATLGYPLTQVLSNSVKITTGNVNSLLGLADDTRYLQISTPVQPGNSGGPLVDKAGSLLGVTSAVLKSSATGDASVTPQNVNFAIRASVVELFLQSRSIPFQTAETAGAPLATADLADKVSPSVVQLLCYGAKLEPTVAAAPPEPSTPAAIVPFRPFRHFDNQDVIGFDYATLRRVSRDECVAACRDDMRCQAVTYHKAARFCFLKNDAVLTVWNRDAVGVISAGLVSTVLQTSFSVSSGMDQPGGDYLHLTQSSFVGCFLACGKDDRCRSFAYVRKSNSCWLKDGIGGRVKRAGVDLGIK